MSFNPGEIPMSDEMKAIHKIMEALNSECGFFSSLKSCCLAACSSYIRHTAQKYAADFHNGGQELNLIIGVINTVLLLTSS